MIRGDLSFNDDPTRSLSDTDKDDNRLARTAYNNNNNNNKNNNNNNIVYRQIYFVRSVTRQDHAIVGQRVRRLLFRRRGRHRDVHDAHPPVRLRVRVRETQVGHGPIVRGRPQRLPQHQTPADRSAVRVHRTRTGVHLLRLFKGSCSIFTVLQSRAYLRTGGGVRDSEKFVKQFVMRAITVKKKKKLKNLTVFF